MKNKRISVLLALAILVAACATTQNSEASYWQSRKGWMAAQENYNNFLMYDNARIAAGAEPLLDQQARLAALEITREALTIFEEIEPYVGDEDKTTELLLALNRANELALKLTIIFTSVSEDQ